MLSATETLQQNRNQCQKHICKKGKIREFIDFFIKCSAT